MSSDVEQVWCEVSTHHGGDKYLFGCIYRPPLSARTSDDKARHASIVADINKSIAVATRAVNAGLYKGVCVSGDFNFPYLGWSDDSVINHGKHDGLAGAFLDTLEDLSLYQAVRVQTFFSASGTSSNVLDLDLILCDRSERIDIKNEIVLSVRRLKVMV